MSSFQHTIRSSPIFVEAVNNARVWLASPLPETNSHGQRRYQTMSLVSAARRGSLLVVMTGCRRLVQGTLEKTVIASTC